MSRLSPDEMAHAVLTLDLTWSGRVFRFASAPVAIPDPDGTSHAYAGGLDLQWEDVAPLLDDGPRDDIDLGEIVLPVDVARWHAEGRDLVACPAVLSLWAPGRDIDERQVLMVGTVDATEHGADGEPVALSMRPPSTEDGAVYPPAGAVVSAETWPDAHVSELGKPYPWVIGKPGLPSGTVPALARGGAPALLVDTDSNGTWLVSIGRVAAATVVLIAGDGTTEAIAVTHQTDARGQLVAVVVGTSSSMLSAGGPYSVDWSASAGGTLAVGKTTAALGAGEIALLLLSRTTVAYDVGAWRAVSRRLDRYRLSFYVESTSPLAVLRSEVLPLLPVSEVSGPSGVAPVLWRWTATEADAVTHLEEGRNVTRASPVGIDRDGMANLHSITYAPRWDDGEGAYTLTDETHPSAKASRIRYGVRASAFDTPNVYDASTARLILADRASSRSLPVRRVAYTGGPELGVLARGDVVTLTDADLWLDGQVALVEGRTFAAASVRLALVLVPVPARDARPT